MDKSSRSTPKADVYAANVMCVWWYWQGIINLHFIKSSVILNIHLYSQYLERFDKSLVKKRSSVGKRCSYLWQCKNAWSMINTGNNFKIQLVSSTLPAIFTWTCKFCSLQNALIRKKEEKEDQIQEFVEYVFKSKSAKSYSKGTEDLATVSYNGEYIIVIECNCTFLNNKCKSVY